MPHLPQNAFHPALLKTGKKDTIDNTYKRKAVCMIYLMLISAVTQVAVLVRMSAWNMI